MIKNQFLTYRDLKSTMIAIIFYTDIIAEQIAGFCKTRVFRGCTKIAMYKCNTCERTETSFHFCYSCSKHHFQLLHENIEYDIQKLEKQNCALNNDVENMMAFSDKTCQLLDENELKSASHNSSDEDSKLKLDEEAGNFKTIEKISKKTCQLFDVVKSKIPCLNSSKLNRHKKASKFQKKSINLSNIYEMQYLSLYDTRMHEGLLMNFKGENLKTKKCGFVDDKQLEEIRNLPVANHKLFCHTNRILKIRLPTTKKDEEKSMPIQVQEDLDKINHKETVAKEKSCTKNAIVPKKVIKQKILAGVNEVEEVSHTDKKDQVTYGSSGEKNDKVEENKIDFSESACPLDTFDDPILAGDPEKLALKNKSLAQIEQDELEECAFKKKAFEIHRTI